MNQVIETTKDEFTVAVNAASAAFESWKDVEFFKRQKYMFELRKKLIEAKEELAYSIVAEHGKPLSAARREVEKGIRMVEYCCNLSQYFIGESL